MTRNRQRRSEPSPTEVWDIGQRVKIVMPGHMLNGLTGKVSDRDSDYVEVRFDTITEEMKHYEDTRKGLCMIDPACLERI